jgi:hypothetical protein
VETQRRVDAEFLRLGFPAEIAQCNRLKQPRPHRPRRGFRSGLAIVQRQLHVCAAEEKQRAIGEQLIVAGVIASRASSARIAGRNVVRRSNNSAPRRTSG